MAELAYDVGGEGANWLCVCVCVCGWKEKMCLVQIDLENTFNLQALKKIF